jgi:hypothetical protein
VAPSYPGNHEYDIQGTNLKCHGIGCICIAPKMAVFKITRQRELVLCGGVPTRIIGQSRRACQRIIFATEFDRLRAAPIRRCDTG